ncbi:M48 family metallopeptidase [Thiohalorhabdus sp. Cl-TMA]|uniref:M48 family metallopeptidase n=1 Tax=Thiohalorhabdus methylotrophus TaxID=3242694 RepID=A0ABV4TVW6_9GAMM
MTARVLARSWLGALLAALVIAGCYTVPETGRQSLMLVPQAQMVDMGIRSFRQIKEEEPVSDDPRARRRVEEVGSRIARVTAEDTRVPPEEWQFVAFANEQKNAFALPGGRVGAYEGILEVAKNDAQLATVMGHEVAHVAARHGGERMSELLLVQMGGIALATALNEKPARTQQLFLAAYGLGAQVGILLPHSRQQELEADRIGLMYMARAGYDPRAAVDFWQRMDESTENGGPPVFLSTHPPHGKRIERLKKWMPEAMEEYRAARARRGANRNAGR